MIKGCRDYLLHTDYTFTFVDGGDLAWHRTGDVMMAMASCRRVNSETKPHPWQEVVHEDDVANLMERGDRRTTRRTSMQDNATSRRPWRLAPREPRNPPPPPPASTSTTEIRRLAAPVREEPPPAQEGLCLIRRLLELDGDLPQRVREGLAVLPEYVRDNTDATLQDMNVAESGRFAVALQAFVSILMVEMGEIIDRHIQEREDAQQDNDTHALMQLGLGMGKGNGEGGGRDDDHRPPWRPRKRGRDARRRALNRRRRNLDMDVAEWQARAGPTHDHAIAQTSQIARQLRSALSQPVQVRDRTGMCREESDRMQEAMMQSGDRGSLIMLAAALEMVGSILFDLRSTINIHVLSQAARARETRRRRRHVRGPSASSGLYPPRRRRARSKRPEPDLTNLMQNTMVVKNGVQLGDIPEEEVNAIAIRVQDTLRDTHGEAFRNLLTNDIALRAARNQRSKVPAVRKVAKAVEQRIKFPDATLKQVKKEGKKLWAKVRAAALKWARKKKHLDLLQMDVQLLAGAVPLVSFMQTQLDVVNVEDDNTAPYENGEDEHRKLCGDEGLWYNRLQEELQRLKKGGRAVGAHVAQLHYYVKQLRTGRIWDQARAEALDALLVSMNDEEVDERNDHADEWALKWRRGAVAFLGADDRACLDAPYVPDAEQLRAAECEMFARLREEMAEELASMRAQASEDAIMAEALAECTQTPSGPSCWSATSTERAVTITGGNKGVKRSLATASVTNVVEDGNGVTVSVRVSSSRPSRTVGVQTDG